MVSAGKVTIINDAADVAQPMLSREESRAILGIDPADVALGTAGYFTKEKNVPLLLELASSLGREFPNVKLVCIGPIAPKMRAETRRRRNLLAVGYLPDAVRYYRAFDAYVSAATKEGFGSALLDAVARDIPCAALDSGGVRDQFGRFVKYLAHDAGELIRMVHSIIQDRAAALRYAQGQGAWARSIFSVENMLQKHIDVYTSVLARHS
jgi:glycosyltransferase involved in cell wall biosynthesis